MGTHRPGRIAIEPQPPGLRNRIWWGAGTRQTALWAATQCLNLLSSTVLLEDTGVPLNVAQTEQIRLWTKLSPKPTLLTLPPQLGVDYASHPLATLIDHVAPAAGWR